MDPNRFWLWIAKKSEHLKTDQAAMLTKITPIFPAKNNFKNKPIENT
jgi:hypothetical protein